MNKLYNLDCLKGMSYIKKNLIDTIITDPPYGINFMGKKWDYDIPSIKVWRECYRVLKPGGTILVFAGARTQHRMAVNIEDAGFILKDVILWLYGQGFPKATDISKQIDKQAGAEREIIGIRKKSESFDHADNNVYSHGDKRIIDLDITLPSTDSAQKWEGWKSHSLKPAYEPIIMAMKPNDGSYADNALKWNVAGLNIDKCRIELNDNEINLRPNAKNHTTNKAAGIEAFAKIEKNKNRNEFLSDKGFHNSKGRFPANVILDEEAGSLLDKQSGILKSGAIELHHNSGDKTGYKTNSIFGKYKAIHKKTFTSEGGASRFFYCAKTSPGERGADNRHPTVKPIKLMEYLCKLTITPFGGIIMDPFAGSGTTALAAFKTERRFIGFEKEKEFYKIAVKRIENYKNKLRNE